jgi:hypothetical protein
MARPERNNIDYFPFFCEEGKKMFYLEETYGNDGFAVFVKLLRELAKTDYHYLDLSKNSTLMFLSAKCKVPKQTLECIINDLVDLEKFNPTLWNENRIIWCQDFIDSIQDAYSKRKNKCISLDGLFLLLVSLGVRKPIKGSSKGVINPQSKVEYSKVDESKEKEKYLFFDFWTLYPKKVAKTKCEKKFNSLKDKDKEKIMLTLPGFIKHKPFTDYTHPNPYTYLNQERWNDEIPKASNTSNQIGAKKDFGTTNQVRKWK